MHWMTRWLRPGMTVVDVGANQGTYTRAFREVVGPSGTVIAVEPHVELRFALERAGASEVVTAVLGDRTGHVTLYESRETPHASLWASNVLEPTGKTRTVTMKRLDDLGYVPDLVKLDTQGAEGAILKGAQRMLSDVRPVWYVELWNAGLAQAQSSVDAVCKAFEAHGYMPDDSTWDRIRADAKHQRDNGSIDVTIVPQERMQ